METPSESDSEVPKTERKVRRSIFNRTESGPPKYEINFDETKELEEYQKKLESEKLTWKELLVKSAENNSKLKGKLKSDLEEYLEENTLSNEDIEFLESHPNYSYYISKISDLYEACLIIKNQILHTERIENNYIENIKSRINKLHKNID